MLAAPLLLVYFLARGYRDSNYFHSFAERVGTLPRSFKRTAPGGIWLHAVSVGEVISSVRLIQELRKRSPGTPIFVSTATLAGRGVAEQKLGSLADGVFYSPIDYTFAVRRVLRRIRPAVVVILETEIWPVLFRETKRAQCGLLILNGRISDRTAGRYRMMRWVFRSVLRLPDAIYVQTERDRMRYVGAGAAAETVSVGGNLKHEAAAIDGRPPNFVTELIERLRPGCVWIAASTMPGLSVDDVDEDDVVIEAYLRLMQSRPEMLLILAPRRPDRFALAREKLSRCGVRFVTRSGNRLPPDLVLPCILLLDTIGELASIFPLGDVVFMGGTLARRGGHNVLEPAACQKAIVAGPHMENFADIAESFRAGEAWLQIAGAGDLAGAVERLLGDANLRRLLGTRAGRLARGQTGIAARFADEVLRVQDRAVPSWGLGRLRKEGYNRLATLGRPDKLKHVLRVLSIGWVWAGRLKAKRDLANRLSLSTPVISVGGIAMGGSGKTPFVDMLAGELSERGLQVAILTRGYRRSSGESAIIPAGSSASYDSTGDEAQILVRSGRAHVGVGVNRGAIGALMESRLKPDVFLLDDGFQHRKLARQLDIVLIDALDPFPGGAPFPLGFLREPMEALGRADAFVITRAQPNRRYEGIRCRLREVNSTAPIFTASVEAVYWVNERTKERVGHLDIRVAAFCGLGNPSSFWQTLSDLGVDRVFEKVFSDHHRYTARELRALATNAQARGAKALITTEKDLMNLPGDAMAVLEGVELYWLKIATLVRERDELMSMVARAVARGRRRDS